MNFLKQIINKLEFKIFFFLLERLQIKILLNRIFYLKNLKTIPIFSIIIKYFHNNKNIFLEDFIIKYIITISFKKANTRISISDSQGNLKIFYSAGFVKLIGKQKIKRKKAISKLIPLLLKNFILFNKKAIALHLKNVTLYKNYILKKIKQSFYVKIIKIFNFKSYNGCKKRKLRRKKFIKTFK